MTVAVRHLPAAIAALLALLSSCDARSGRDSTVPSAKAPEFKEVRSSSGAAVGKLRKLDDFPLFELGYVASYDLESAVASSRRGSAFACTCFVAANPSGKRIFGRNFDWDRHPVLVLRTRPAGAFASISLVDIHYLGYSSASSPFDSPDRLADAPFIPFDGMNERGLAVGMMAVPSADSGDDPAKRGVDELLLIRLMLDRAATLDEALAIAGSYDVDFGQVPIHYLVADASGASAVIEYIGGKLVVTRSGRAWQVSTNFTFSGSLPGKGVCARYDAAESALSAAAGSISDPFALLSEVSQDNTIWSSLYDLGAKTLQLAVDRKYGRIYRFAVAAVD